MAEHIFEVCANSFTSAKAAQEGGANRIELCADLQTGGLTPSAAEIKLTIQNLTIPVFVLIRPRGGDFLYSKYEFEVMKEDILYAKDCGAAGVVFGILNPSAKIDVERCAALVNIAKPMHTTFHRAFDRVADYSTALEDVIKTGAQRILTSGLSEIAADGKALLKRLVELAENRISIMAGGGITPESVTEIILQTGVNEVHASCSAVMQSNMNTHFNKTAFTSNNKNTVTDVEVVKKMVAAIKQI